MPRIDQIDRQTDTLILLFSYSPTIRGVTRIQKMLFLLNQETKYGKEQDEGVLFDFKPYKMGPFAVSIYEELDFLLEMGVIEEERQESRIESGQSSIVKEFTLTDKGNKIAKQLQEILSEEVNADLEQFVQRYSTMELKRLLQYVYTQFPHMAKNSEIRDSLY